MQQFKSTALFFSILMLYWIWRFKIYNCIVSSLFRWYYWTFTFFTDSRYQYLVVVTDTLSLQCMKLCQLSPLQQCVTQLILPLLTGWPVNNAPDDLARRVISCYLEEPRRAERGRCYISLGHRTLRTHTPTMVAARLVSALLPLRTKFTRVSINKQ